MSERFPGSLLHRARWRRVLPRLSLLVFALVLSGAASCSESIDDGGGACPLLCPGRENEFRDTIVDAVVLDTSFGTFPTSGLNGLILLANRGDTIQSSVAIRYDQIQTSYRPNNTGDTVSITAIDSVWLRLALDTTGNRGTEPVLLEAFDIDTTQSDSVTSVVQSLFRPDRLLGAITITPSTVGDSLRVPLDAAKVLSRIRNGARVRVGLRLASHGQVRIVAFALGSGAALLNFDPVGDTLYAPVRTIPFTSFANASTEQQLAYSIYGIIDRASAPIGAGQLQVGGVPASRGYFRFDLDRAFLDSNTIVRAELLLTQVASPNARTNDTLFVDLLVPTASELVTDLRRVLDLAAIGSLVDLDSTRLLPAESGLRTINILAIVRGWRVMSANVPRAIGLRVMREGFDPLDVRFVSAEGATSPEQRPRLRITYLPRAEFARP